MTYRQAWRPVIARTESGEIRGLQEDDLCVFRGVPYAKPPIGPLRFRDPQPPDWWDGISDALAFAPASIQLWSPEQMEQGAAPEATSEDCLYLNIWTPGLDEAKRPVMVWIHGGGFVQGSGSARAYWGSPLARRGDVVVITINYRLGLLGFLADPRLTDGGETMGNYGVKDQIAALQWVRANIAAFGGDPDNVTLFGQSAGGTSVAVLLAARSAAGLFHHAVIQSGTDDHGLSPRLAMEVRSLSYRLLGFEDEPSVEELRALPSQHLLNAQTQFRVTLELQAQSKGPSNPYAPLLDGELLDLDPIEALRRGRSHEVDLMAGTIRDEWILGETYGAGADYVDEEIAIGVCAAYVAAYPPWRDPFDLYTAYQQIRAERGKSIDPRSISNAVSFDYVFRRPTRALLNAHAHSSGGTYSYLFDQSSPQLDATMGAPHGIELGFVFGTYDASPHFSGIGPQVDQLSRLTMDAWINFARHGNPNTNALPGWPECRADQTCTMVLGSDAKTIAEDREEEFAPWRTDIIE